MNTRYYFIDIVLIHHDVNTSMLVSASSACFAYLLSSQIATSTTKRVSIDGAEVLNSWSLLSSDRLSTRSSLYRRNCRSRRSDWYRRFRRLRRSSLDVSNIRQLLTQGLFRPLCCPLLLQLHTRRIGILAVRVWVINEEHNPVRTKFKSQRQCTLKSGDEPSRKPTRCVSPHCGHI